MANIKKYFILSMLSLLLVLLTNSFAKEAETDKITITDAKQLKGIWEAFYIYQEMPRQERINTYIPPFPQREEFESIQEHQERVDDIKNVYERRVEENFKKDINNEQRFKNMVFKLKFSCVPIETPYKHEEEIIAKRVTLGTRYFKIPVAFIQKFQDIMFFFETHIIHEALSSPIPSTVPPAAAQWRIEEDDLLIQEDIAYLNFSLDRYDMERKSFPVIFSPSQFPEVEKDWVYYIRKLNYGDYYMELFENSDAEKKEQWSIKFDKLPTYIPFSFNKAKTIRAKEQKLTLELEFQPVLAEKKINSNTVYNTLQVKLISATLKDGNDTLYVMADTIQ